MSTAHTFLNDDIWKEITNQDLAVLCYSYGPNEVSYEPEEAKNSLYLKVFASMPVLRNAKKLKVSVMGGQTQDRILYKGPDGRYFILVADERNNVVLRIFLQ